MLCKLYKTNREPKLLVPVIGGPANVSVKTILGTNNWLKSNFKYSAKEVPST